ncbi:Tannase/feruloyl esterase, partial [Aspergillus avenaceus]
MKNLTCTPATIQAPTVPGADIHTLSAAWVTNYTSFAPGDFNYNGGDVAVQSAKFCNITVTYTHPGYNDNITVETWLPASEQWNGRLQAIGGGGWAAGRFPLTGVFMDGALGEGYATTTTDAGLGLDTQGPLDWALLSPGNFDYVTLNNFAARALNDQALIGKGLIQSFYGRAPEYSYWSGCSQGGRQGMMLAQRYPTAYDGIAASAPAQSITKFTSNLYYPIFMRLWHGVDPLTCELDYLTKEAIKACDPLDGVTDGLISNMTACNYDPYTAVNKTFECAGLNRTIPLSQGAALVAQAAWSGAHTTDGRQLWYGYNPGTDITKFGAVPGQNSSIPSEDMWFNLFGAKNASFDTFAMSHEQYQEAFHSITQEFSSMFDAADPDLSAFKAAGGKLITYHGL